MGMKRKHKVLDTYKKERRIIKLCQKRKYEFNKVMDADLFEKIDTWCKEELNGCYYWFWRSHHSETQIIGFQDDTDMMAFILRWE